MSKPSQSDNTTSSDNVNLLNFNTNEFKKITLSKIHSLVQSIDNYSISQHVSDPTQFTRVQSKAMRELSVYFLEILYFDIYNIVNQTNKKSIPLPELNDLILSRVGTRLSNFMNYHLSGVMLSINLHRQLFQLTPSPTEPLGVIILSPTVIPLTENNIGSDEDYEYIYSVFDEVFSKECMTQFYSDVDNAIYDAQELVTDSSYTAVSISTTTTTANTTNSQSALNDSSSISSNIDDGDDRKKTTVREQTGKLKSKTTPATSDNNNSNTIPYKLSKQEIKSAIQYIITKVCNRLLTYAPNHTITLLQLTQLLRTCIGSKALSFVEARLGGLRSLLEADVYNIHVSEPSITHDVLVSVVPAPSATTDSTSTKSTNAATNNKTNASNNSNIYAYLDTLLSADSDPTKAETITGFLDRILISCQVVKSSTTSKVKRTHTLASTTSFSTSNNTTTNTANATTNSNKSSSSQEHYTDATTSHSTTGAGLGASRSVNKDALPIPTNQTNNSNSNSTTSNKSISYNSSNSNKDNNDSMSKIVIKYTIRFVAVNVCRRILTNSPNHTLTLVSLREELQLCIGVYTTNRYSYNV